MTEKNKQDVLILYEVSRGQSISTDDYDRLVAMGLVGKGMYTDLKPDNTRDIKTILTDKGDQLIREKLAS